MMKYNPRFGVLFACSPPPAWCKLDGYMQVEAEFQHGSFQITGQVVKDLEVCYTYDNQSKYHKLLKVLTGEPRKEIYSRELWELLSRTIRLVPRRKGGRKQ